MGLGNPGPRYAETRHNAGFRTADVVAAALDTRYRRPWFRNYTLAAGMHGGGKVYVAKPLTFMNRSGEAVERLVQRTGLQPSQMVVVYDNLDLSPGRIRLKRQGSSGGHRGVQSIIEHLGTNDFPRLSIGIGRPARKEDVIAYVLQEPFGDEEELLESACEDAARAVLDLVTNPIEDVMNSINQRP